VIDLSGYTAKAIEKAMLSQVSADIDTREGSVVQTAVGPAAWYLEGVYMTLGQLQENAYAESAVGKSLDLIVRQRGLARIPAVAAVRKGIFNVPVASGSLFKTINGASSVIFVSGEPLSESGGNYLYKMTCQIPGVAGNSYMGNMLPITAVSGLTSAVIGDIITAGAEEETDAALRARFFETFNVEAFGGNIQSYRNAILSIAGVGAVQVYPAWRGGGTVLCGILGDDLKPALSAVVRKVQEFICPPEDGETTPSANGYGMAPVGAAVTVVSGTELTLNITLDAEFISGMVNGVETYQKEIEDMIEDYLNTVRKSWGAPLKGHSIEYPVTIYISRIIFSILTIPAIVNVSNVRINGSENDLRLEETPELQQVPVLGKVVINRV
jgi:uncharacterized phage protein gp47/JayE